MKVIESANRLDTMGTRVGQQACPLLRFPTLDKREGRGDREGVGPAGAFFFCSTSANRTFDPPPPPPPPLFPSPYLHNEALILVDH